MTTEDLLTQEAHFAFGKNWLDYAKKIDEAKIAQAVVDLGRLCGAENLHDKMFLDIGCGSGLHALAALRMGAKRVVGVDIDPDSVVAARATVTRFCPTAAGKGSASEFEVCSVFDMSPGKFGTFDVVYSWGVLHHTGDMNRAIGCASALVAPQGEILLALYKKTPFCWMWRDIKRWYSRATPERQAKARGLYVGLKRVAGVVKGRDFRTTLENYKRRRGMDFYNDVHDWLGGYPYESISPDECHTLLKRLGFETAREFLNPVRFPYGLGGSGCDEYAFRRVRQADERTPDAD